MCQQNRMLVSDLNCLVLKELNEKRKQKKVIEDMTVTFYQYLHLPNVEAPVPWACSHKKYPEF